MTAFIAVETACNFGTNGIPIMKISGHHGATSLPLPGRITAIAAGAVFLSIIHKHPGE